MKTMLNILVLIAVISSGSNQLMAQWIQTGGPEGGNISGFVNIDTNLFAATNHGGVFFSTDNGTSWTPVNNGLWATSVNALAVSGTNLFAGTMVAGIYKSSNNGDSWVFVDRPGSIHSLAISGTYLFAGGNAHVFRSSNNGATWDPAVLPTAQRINALAVNGTYLFAGSSGDGVFLSTNNGVGWTPVNNGLTDTVVYSLAVHGTDLFAGTAGGVFFSADSASHWTAAGLTNQEIRALTVSGTNLFAGAGVGVFRSSDKGANWDSVNNAFMDVRALTVSDTNLFAGGWMVSWSSNNGDSWTNISTGLWGTERVNALAVSGTYLYTGHRGTSVWRRPLSDIITSVESFSSEPPLHFFLEQNYPNPFNSETIFRYQLPKTSHVNISIYNVMGQLVRTLIDGKKESGYHIAKWDSRNNHGGLLGTGIYFAKFKADEFSDVKKVLLIK